MQAAAVEIFPPQYETREAALSRGLFALNDVAVAGGYGPFALTDR